MNTILEIVVVEISEPNEIIVISVYRPPSTLIDVFMNNMLDIIAQFQNIPICIVGDFNEDVSITSNTPCFTFLRLQAFKQMVSTPTHDSGTIIDHVYVSQTINTMQTDVTDCYYSDHHLILCTIAVSLTYVAFLNNSIHVINTTLWGVIIVEYFVKWTGTQICDGNVTLIPYQIYRGYPSDWNVSSMCSQI